MKNKVCKAPGCNGVYYGNGYCKKHYKQLVNHGHILDRTRFMPNEIVKDLENNVAYIILYDAQQEENARCIIDLEDIEKIKNYRWTFRKKLFVAHVPFKGKERKLVYYLFDGIDGKTVYYKNNNALDCRKKNIILNKNELHEAVQNDKYCPFCGSEEYYIKQKFRGNCNYVKRFDGKKVDNTNLHANAIYTKISNYAFCNKCHRKLFKLEDTEE